MGLHHACTSFSAQEGACLHPDQALAQGSAIVLQCASTIPGVTFFYACKMSHSVSLGWVRGHFHGELGQSDWQFQDVRMHM